MGMGKQDRCTPAKRESPTRKNGLTVAPPSTSSDQSARRRAPRPRQKQLQLLEASSSEEPKAENTVQLQRRAFRENHVQVMQTFQDPVVPDQPIHVPEQLHILLVSVEPWEPSLMSRLARPLPRQTVSLAGQSREAPTT